MSNEEMQKTKQKEKDNSREGGQANTQAQQTTKNLSDFIDEEEENFNEEDFKTDTGPSAESGISGITEEEATSLITNMIAGNIPQEHRQEFLQTYPVRVETLLKFVGFQELTEGANVKEMPSWVRILIMIVGVGGLTFATVKKYKPVTDNYDQQQEEQQNEEGWRG